MPNCVVTGGAGFIGSHLAQALLDQGWHVTILDNFLTGSRANVEALRGRGSLRLIEGDVRDPADVSEALAGASVVFHQAALPSVPRSIEEPRTTNDINVAGTLNVLQEAVRLRVQRVVYASSSSAYGDRADRGARNEDQTPAPRSPYAVSKLAGEMYCRAYADTFGLHTVCIRYFNVFGPRQDPASTYAAVIPRFLTAMMEDRPPKIFGDGQQSRDFTFIDNIVLLNILAATRDCPPGSLFNGGCGVSTSLNELISLIRDLTGYAGPVEHHEARQGDVRHSLADLTRAHDVLGYETAVPLRDGLSRTMRSLRAARSRAHAG